MLLWGGIRVVDGAILIGTLLAAVLYVRNFFAPLQEVAFFLNSYQSATAALEKVSGVLEEEPTVPDPVKPVDLWEARGHIALRRRASSATANDRIDPARLLARHPGRSDDRARRHDRSRQVDAREARVAVLRPDTRPVTLDGVDLRSLHPKDLRRAIVMVTQEAYLFSGTVADNIALGKPDATLDEIRRRRAPWGRMPSSSACPTATAPTSTSAAAACRRVSAS